MVPSDCISLSFPPYTLIKYPSSKKHDPEYRSFRSAIYKEDKLVCMSPSKSVLLDKTIPIDQYVIEEFVEGVMINLFYDDGWKIATKSNVGANCTFDSPRTFAELFEECKQHIGLNYDTLNKNLCYSFVMQHPDHPIVNPVSQPSLTCVAIFHEGVERFSDILPPKRFQFSSYEDALEASQQGNIKGLVFKYQGLRSTLKNTLHHSIEKMKENMPFPYRYVYLKKTQKLTKYLQYFPEDQVKCNNIENQIRNATQQLYTTYRTCFVYKKEKAKEHPMRSSLYDLHNIYLQELYPMFLSKKRVEEYVCSHLFLLNP